MSSETSAWRRAERANLLRGGDAAEEPRFGKILCRSHGRRWDFRTGPYAIFSQLITQVAGTAPALTEELNPLRRGRTEGEQVQPDDLNAYAWILLTCETEEQRDPRAAFRMARRTVEQTGKTNYNVLDTLALVYKETGDIDAAVETQHKALALMPAEPSPTRAELEGRLGEYLTLQGDCSEAEGVLLSAYDQIIIFQSPAPKTVSEALEPFVGLYGAWNAAEPGKSYGERAAEWRAKLPETAYDPGSTETSE